MTSRLSAEWLEADGLGGFASGTVAGIRTRRYHALLLSATTPPTGRVVLVNGLEVWLGPPAGSYPLSSQRYAPDVVHPDGQDRIVGFRRRALARWTFRTEDGTEIGQEIVVCHGRGEVVVALASAVVARPRAPDGSARCCRAATTIPCTTRTRASISAPRSPARACYGDPIRACRRSRRSADGSYRQRPGLVPQLPVRCRARARPRLGRGSGLARRLQLDAQRPRCDLDAACRRSPPDVDANRLVDLRGAAPPGALRERARARRRRLRRAARQRQDDRRRLSLVHRLGPRHLHRIARLCLATRRPGAGARHPARLGRRGVRGHAAQPLSRTRARCPSSTPSTPRCGT